MKANYFLPYIKGSKDFEVKPCAEAELNLSGAELSGKVEKAFPLSGFSFFI